VAPTAPVLDWEVVVSEAEKIWTILNERGASIVCPFCGSEEWLAFGELKNLRVVLPAAIPTGELVKVTSETGGFGVIPFACSNCGFVRLHSAHVLGQGE
jgi:predicted RNA-binding Zn-ribbon protein involved in translation (DUF1610 family)